MRQPLNLQPQPQPLEANMSKHHVYALLAGAVIGYLMADKLIAKQPWKTAFSLSSNL